MANVYTFCNQKGGVGKTTSVINLAAAIALRNEKVLVIDLDPQGNATSGLGIDKLGLSKTIYDAVTGNDKLENVIQKTGIENLEIAPANSDLTGAEVELVDEMGREFILKRSIDEMLKTEMGMRYNYVFIDCPPSLGILTLNALVASQKIVIPVQCEYYALEGLGQLLKTIQLVKERLNSSLDVAGVILTMADFRTNLTSEVIQEVKNYFAGKVFSSVIPRSVKLSEAPSFGKPAVIYDTLNRGTKSYVELAREFLSREGGGDKTVTVTEEKKEETSATMPGKTAETAESSMANANS